MCSFLVSLLQCVVESDFILSITICVQSLHYFPQFNTIFSKYAALTQTVYTWLFVDLKGFLLWVFAHRFTELFLLLLVFSVYISSFLFYCMHFKISFFCLPALEKYKNQSKPRVVSLLFFFFFSQAQPIIFLLTGFLGLYGRLQTYKNICILREGNRKPQ